MGEKARKQMVPGHRQKQMIAKVWPRTLRFGARRLFGLTLLLCLVSGVAGSALAAEAGLVVVPLLDSPVRGPKDAPVTMVEFLDFQ